MPTPRPSRSLAWNLGAFVGEITRAIRTPVDRPAGRRIEVDRRTSESRRDGGLVLRRTTIDEIELPPDARRPGGD